MIKLSKDRSDCLLTYLPFVLPSFSRSESNASSATPPQKHCTRHRRCHDNWNNRRHDNAGTRPEQTEQTACNGRMIQIIVIVLVIIMAIW